MRVVFHQETSDTDDGATATTVVSMDAVAVRYPAVERQEREAAIDRLVDAFQRAFDAWAREVDAVPRVETLEIID